MITETSADIVRSQIATHLVESLVKGDDASLDIIELIALRMPTRENYQVAVLGYFVRANLFYLSKSMITFAEILERFTSAALHAPYGHEDFARHLDAGASPYSF